MTTTCSQFLKMFERHRRALQLYARHLSDEPMELLHTCLAKVLDRKNYKGFSHNKGEFCSWFTRIVLNEARDQKRRAAVRARYEVSIPMMEGGDASAEYFGEPLVFVSDPPSDLSVDVRKAVEGLPPLSRWAAERVFIEGMSYQEAASDLGLPGAIVREAGRVALVILRAKLQAYAPERRPTVA